MQVAARRITDQVRSEAARRHREQLVVSLVPPEEQLVLAADEAGASERDDTLELLFMCCHPVLSPASAIALTLRTVGGLTTFEIAKAFLVPEATMAQRSCKRRSRRCMTRRPVRRRRIGSMSDNPMVTLNHASALAMVRGPAAGLERLLERAGDREGAIIYYRRAAERTTSTSERNYLLTHAARLRSVAT